MIILFNKNSNIFQNQYSRNFKQYFLKSMYTNISVLISNDCIFLKMLTILYPAGLLQDFSNNLAFYKVNKAGGTIYICQHVLCLNCKIVAGLFQNFVAGLLQDCLSSLKYSLYVVFNLIFTCAMPETAIFCKIRIQGGGLSHQVLIVCFTQIC